MKITMKPLKGSSFDVEADPEQKVEELKKIVAIAAAEYPADQQKLIYSGRILKDDELVKDIGVKEGQFIVVMAAKAKPPAGGAASATPAAQPAAAAPAAAATTPAAAPASAPDAAAAAPNATEQAAANLVTGTAAEATITQLCEMGFGRAEVERCLQAAFGNPDRAVEYLMNGIPEGILAPAGGAPPPAAGGATAPAPGGAAPAPAPAGGRNAAFPAMTGTGGGGGGGGGTGQLPPVLANLRNSPQFTQYAQMIAQNPAALEGLLGVIAQTNPEVVQAIQENQEAFMQMLQEAAGGGGADATDDPVAAMLAAGGQAPGGGGLGGGEAAQLQRMAGMLAQNPAMVEQILPQIEASNPELAAAIRENPQALVQMLQEAGAGGMGGGMGGGMPPGQGPTVIQLTEEENAAVGRLVALGFDRQTAAQAYLACDKNEEIAANFLFENGDADMD